MLALGKQKGERERRWCLSNKLKDDFIIVCVFISLFHYDSVSVFSAQKIKFDVENNNCNDERDHQSGF